MGGGGDLFEGGGCEGGKPHGDVIGGAGAGGGHFAVWVGEALHCSGGDAEWDRGFGVEDEGRGVDLGDVPEDAGPDAVFLVGFDVLEEG